MKIANETEHRLCVFTSRSHIVFALLSLAAVQPDAAALWDMMSGRTHGAPVDLRTKPGRELIGS